MFVKRAPRRVVRFSNYLFLARLTLRRLSRRVMGNAARKPKPSTSVDAHAPASAPTRTPTRPPARDVSAAAPSTPRVPIDDDDDDTPPAPWREKKQNVADLEAIADAEAWLHRELSGMAISRDYPELASRCAAVAAKWKRGMPKSVWLRVIKGGRLVKELNESAPVSARTMKYVDALRVSGREDKAVIVDLCSGFGYLAMFLSELLPEDKVDEIVLVDKMWAAFGTTPMSHHMNWAHVRGEDGWKYEWPIKLSTRKVDLKDYAQINQMAVHLFSRWNGPFIVLGIHLCGTLSIKAVEMFNRCSNVKHLILKPCCLPDFSWTYKIEHFEVGSHKHKIPTKDVCSKGKWKRNKWVGPPRHHLKLKFEAWNDHLCRSIDDEDGNITKKLQEIRVQERHFQNLFIFSDRERTRKCIVREATGCTFPTPSGTEAGRWAPTGSGFGTHVRRVAA